MRIYRILSAILLVCSLSPLFSAELPSQFTISTAVEKELTEHGLDCQRTVIAPEFAGKFPFNITVEIQSTEKENTARKTPYKTAIFAFTQEYFLSDPEFIFKAIEETKERNLPYDFFHVTLKKIHLMWLQTFQTQRNIMPSSFMKQIPSAPLWFLTKDIHLL